MVSWRIPVADLLRAPGSSRRVQLEGVVDGLANAIGGVPAGHPVTVNGRLDGLFDGVWFDGTVSGTFRLECARCLAALQAPFVLAAGELFSRDVTRDSGEGYPLRGEEIDLAPLVRDTVILGIPTHPLCRLECAGLCARCGADLNEGPCTCPAEEGHPAFAALARLFPTDH